MGKKKIGIIENNKKMIPYPSIKDGYCPYCHGSSLSYDNTLMTETEHIYEIMCLDCGYMSKEISKFTDPVVWGYPIKDKTK